jgi:replicative DNA helicase
VAEAESKVAVVGPRRARDKAAVDEIRVPPHSVEAEQAVLGALMLDNRAWDTIADRLVADDFYRRDHQLIFEAIAELAGRSEPSDAVHALEWLERKGSSEDTGGLVYLAGLVRDTPSAANVRAYADAVRERSTLRRLISGRRRDRCRAPTIPKAARPPSWSTRPSGACSRSPRPATRRARASFR